MKVAMFSTHKFDKDIFQKFAQKHGHEILFIDSALEQKTIHLAKGIPCVCVFVRDVLDEVNLKTLAEGGTKLIALRSAGYDHVDLKAAKLNGLTVVRVPAYSPNAIAEHAVALILSLARKIQHSYARVKNFNFSIEGLMGFNLNQKTVGVIGTGKIGSVFAKIMLGFGCEVLGNDLFPDSELKRIGVKYVSLEQLLSSSDIITLHVPLDQSTRYLLNEKNFEKMKKGVMIINTGRGGLIETKAMIDKIKDGTIGFVGLDVYEKEKDFFFEDHSGEIIQDEMLVRLISFPNVIVTSHHAFLTTEAIQNIASTTMQNISGFEAGAIVNEVN